MVFKLFQSKTLLEFPSERHLKFQRINIKKSLQPADPIKLMVLNPSLALTYASVLENVKLKTNTHSYLSLSILWLQINNRQRRKENYKQ